MPYTGECSSRKKKAWICRGKADDLHSSDKKVMKISFEAHKDQTDKGGLPYIYHPYEVAQGVDGEYEICAALLHDVSEDTDITVDDFAAMGFPAEVTDALRLLCHGKTCRILITSELSSPMRLQGK